MADDNPLAPSGKETIMTIAIKVEGYGESNKQWTLPVELARPYLIAYDAGISKLGWELSQGLYEALEGAGVQSVENFAAKPMMEASK
jgi:hypothetical protein